MKIKTRMVFSLLVFFLLSFDMLLAQDWPQWRGRNSDGKMDIPSLDSSKFQLQPGWQRDLGSGYSSMAISDDRVIAMCSDGTDDFLVSFAAQTGNEQWRAKIGTTFQGIHGSEDGPSSSPCIVKENVIVLGPNGDLAAFRLSNGVKRWSQDLSVTLNSRTPVYGFGASPIRCGDNVYLPVNSNDRTCGILLDPETGKVLWKTQGSRIDYQGAYCLESRGEILIADAQRIALIDLSNGRRKFSWAHSEGPGLAYPQLTPIGDSRVLATFKQKCVLLELDRQEKKFKPVWSSREFRDCYSPPVISSGAAYGLCGTFLVSIDLATGRRNWKSRKPGARGLNLVNDMLLLFSSRGEIVCVAADPFQYRELAKQSVAKRGGYTAPVMAGNRIFVRNTSMIASINVVAGTSSAHPANESLEKPSGVMAKLLTQVNLARDPQALVDQWWQQQKSFPIVDDGSIVHFVYRGKAQEVAILGDMCRDRHTPESLSRVGNTDLFFRSYKYVPEGVWHYAFLLNLEKVVTDPNNQSTVPALIDLGGNPRSTGYDDHQFESVLTMPKARTPKYLSQKPQETGRLESIPFDSQFRWIPKKPFQVYLPAGYDDIEKSRHYPVIYILGGNEWIDHADLKRALDNLMGSACQKAIVVLVPYHDGSADRMGGSTYARMVSNDIVPRVEQRYRASKTAIAFGAADDATAALHLFASSPDKFTNAIIFSPYMEEPDFQSLNATNTFPKQCYLRWSKFEPSIGDENINFRKSAESLKRLLQKNNCEVNGIESVQGPGWKSWILDLDQALKYVLPIKHR